MLLRSIKLHVNNKQLQQNQLTVKAGVYKSDDHSVLKIHVTDYNSKLYEIRFNIDWSTSDEHTDWLAECIANSLIDIIVQCKENCRGQIQQAFKNFLNVLDLKI